MQLIGWDESNWLANTIDWLSWFESTIDDLRIQWHEQMVGANHPNLADTLNRLFLVEHNMDGTHK